MLHITECPRDAMQGLSEFIPTSKKIEYINTLLKVGFDTIDFGSFVSPKAIPQLKDTTEVLANLDLKDSKAKLLAIIANERGASDACSHQSIDFLGFPFSVSEKFQQLNTNATIDEAIARVEKIQNLCSQNNKDLMIYISMGFGNPYGEYWHQDIVMDWVRKLVQLDVKYFAISDTVGIAKPTIIKQLFNDLIPEFNQQHFGAHFHSTLETTEEKVVAAVESGCRRFDAALKGFGGCPMANNDLVGNIATESLMHIADKHSYEININREAFSTALNEANGFFQQ